jgi:hypothetical protein
MPFTKIILALAACGGLVACGDTLPEQALSGAAVGAGAAAITSGNLVTGAAVGAAGSVAYCQLYPNKCS